MSVSAIISGSHTPVFDLKDILTIHPKVNDKVGLSPSKTDCDTREKVSLNCILNLMLCLFIR